MIKIILSGANGTMGQVIAKYVKRRQDCEIVAGIDLRTESAGGFPVYASARECMAVEADVLIDFSHPSVLDSLLNMAVERGLPTVIATTGLGGAQIECLHRAAAAAPVFFTRNMSLGMNLMCELSRIAARVLGIGAGYDIEIIEKHHNQKVDAPSGSAMMLAEAIADEFEKKPVFTYERHSRREKRHPAEIGIHAVRGGTIVGEHEVMFAGQDEIFTISHSAASKEVFATGAVNAAVFLHDKPKGFYDMADLIGAGS